MRAAYSEEFKQAALKKILERGDRSIEELAGEVGVSKSVAYRWLNDSGNIRTSMTKTTKSSRQWSTQERYRAVLEFEQLKSDPQKQSEFLRRSGLHGSGVEGWRREMLGALEKSERRPKRPPEVMAKDKRIAELERDLRRKNKALAETTALLVLKKKAELIWGLMDDEESA